MESWKPERLSEEELQDLLLEDLTREQLKQLRERVNEIYAAVESEEPDRTACIEPDEYEAACEDWEERLELLDDLLDDILDQLEE